jgi:replication factor A1
MAIKDLKPKQGKVDVVVDVVKKDEPREFQKFGTVGRVCNATVADDTGEIKLTLWNDDINKVNVGDKIHITNGYVNEWQGELQLTTGKFGKMEVVGKGTAVAGANPTPKKEEPKEEEPVDNQLDEEELDDDDEELEDVEEEVIG